MGKSIWCAPPHNSIVVWIYILVVFNVIVPGITFTGPELGSSPGVGAFAIPAFAAGCGRSRNN